MTDMIKTLRSEACGDPRFLIFDLVRIITSTDRPRLYQAAFEVQWNSELAYTDLSVVNDV